MRAHPMVGDSLIAVVVLLLGLLVWAANAQSARSELAWYVAIPAEIVMAAPLAFRRRYPLWVAYLVLVLSIPHTLLKLGAAQLAASVIALYSLLVYVSRKQAAYYLAALAVLAGFQIAMSSPGDVVADILSFVIVYAGTWLFGEFIAARQAYRSELEARLNLLETERDRVARIAVAEERSRIARELHDVVAHAVSVIVVQADGASYAVQSKPDLAERAIKTISQTGREALAELRRLLDVLRSDEGQSEPRTPRPDDASLNELAERFRAAGIPVQLDIECSLSELPVGVAFGVYRIVQESLTNTLKHAGVGAHAEVRITRAGDQVEVMVTDDGGGRAPALTPSGPLPGGNGLIGMRERAHLLGGSLVAQRAPAGGWRVTASLPTKLSS